MTYRGTVVVSVSWGAPSIPVKGRLWCSSDEWWKPSQPAADPEAAEWTSENLQALSGGFWSFTRAFEHRGYANHRTARMVPSAIVGLVIGIVLCRLRSVDYNRQMENDLVNRHWKWKNFTHYERRSRKKKNLNTVQAKAGILGGKGLWKQADTDEYIHISETILINSMFK